MPSHLSLLVGGKNSGASPSLLAQVHVAEEICRLIPLMRGSYPGNTLSFTISSSGQKWCYLEESNSSNTYYTTFLISIFLHVEAGCSRFSKQMWTRGDGSKAMTLRLHGCKLRSVHSTRSYTWFIYWIICFIRRCMSNMSPYFIWQYNAFERCIVKWSLDWKLDIRRQMGQMVQYMNQVWALLALARHHHILRLWPLHFIPSLHRENNKKKGLGEFDLGGTWMFTCPNIYKNDHI